MLKKFTACLLTAALLFQCLPAGALAEAASAANFLLPQAELDSLAAAYSSAETNPYHAGMAYSDAFSDKQIAGYLQNLEDNEIESLQNTVEMLTIAVAEARETLPQTRLDSRKLKTLDAFMFNLHALKDEISVCADKLNEDMDYIRSHAEDVWNEADFTLAERVSMSKRIEKAAARIAKTRAQISQNRARWEDTIRNSKEALRADGNMNVYLSAANDGSYVTFEPVTETSGNAHEGAKENDWQLRDLYGEIKLLNAPSAPKIYSVSARDMGLEHEPSLLERLTPVRTAYADRQDDATVVIIDDTQFAFIVRDENGAELQGVEVSAVDADRMYTEENPKFITEKTNENGVAVFDIPNNFTLDADDMLNLYVKFSAGSGTLVRGAANGGEETTYTDAHVWQLGLKRGGTFNTHMTLYQGSPVLVAATYNALDILAHDITIYHSTQNTYIQKIYVELDMAPAGSEVFLRYSSALDDPPKGQTGPVVKETSHVELKSTGTGIRTATIADKFGAMFMPGQTVYLVVEDPSGTQTVIDLNIKVEPGAVDEPYTGDIKNEFFSSDGFSFRVPGELGHDASGLSFGVDNPFDLPRATLTMLPDGGLFLTIGAKGGTEVNDKLNGTWIRTPDTPDQTAEGAPDRPVNYSWVKADKQKADEHQSQVEKAASKYNKNLSKFKDAWPGGTKCRELSFTSSVSVKFGVFLSVLGNCYTLGKTADYETRKVTGKVSVGAYVTVAGDFRLQYGIGFGGATISGTLGLDISFLGVSADLLWGDMADFHVQSFQLDMGQTGLDFVVRLTLEFYLGAGIKDFAEISVHGGGYLLYNGLWDWKSSEAEKRDKAYRSTVTGGLYVYVIARLWIFYVRYDVLECSPSKLLYDSWAKDPDHPTANSARSTPLFSGARAANDEDGGDEEEKDAKASTVDATPTYNQDMAVDLTHPLLKKAVPTLDGKVVYARISNGKTKKDTEVTTHTYAFFLHPSREDGPGGAYLQYVDLDAPQPKVFDFQSERKANDRSWWGYRDPWGKDWDAANYETGDFAFDVKTVEDMLGTDEDGNPINPGSSGVVCILTTSLYDETTVDVDGESVTVQKPGGSTQATMFVVTREDDTTGKLSTNTYLWDTTTARTQKREDVKIVSVPSLQCDHLSGGAHFDDLSYPGMQIAASFINDIIDLDWGFELGANVYEAVVLLDPEQGDTDDNVTEAVRYRATAYDQAAFNDEMANDAVFYPEKQRENEHFLNFMGQDDLEIWDSVATKSAGGKSYTIGGHTAGYAVLPFKIDWIMGGRHLWNKKDPRTIDGEPYIQARDLGPLANWFELRVFDDGNADADDTEKKGMFYHLREKDWDGWASQNGNVYPAGWHYFDKTMKGYVDWQPVNDNIPGDGVNGKLLGRSGSMPDCVLLPWNATTKDKEIFFFFRDEKGQDYLESYNLETCELADYGFSSPGAQLSSVDVGDTLVFYWINSHPRDVVGKDESGKDIEGTGYSLSAMIYDRNAQLLLPDFNVAEIGASDDAPPTMPFMTESGLTYFALAATGGSAASADGAITPSNAPTSLTFYKFQQQYTSGIDLVDASFEEGVAHQGAYDNILLNVTNNGNVPLSGFTVNVYDVVKQEGQPDQETLMETIHASLITPEDSYIEYAGSAGGDSKRKETGEEAIRLVDAVTDVSNSGKWFVTKATTTMTLNKNAPDPLPDKWETTSAYMTTDVLMPKDKALFSAPIYMCDTWKGDHTIRFRITGIQSPNAWAIDVDGGKQSKLRSGTMLMANGTDTREIVITRREDGTADVRYAGEAPSGGAVVGGPEESAPRYYNTQITFDELDMDTSKEDVEMTYRLYKRHDGTQMIELSVVNRAPDDGGAKCVTLFAYADQDYANAWFVYDFGNVNAGQTTTITLPLETVKNGRLMHNLTLDLQIDHDDSHSHGGSGLDTGCSHDLHVFDDLVTVHIGDIELTITQQPADQRVTSGSTAHFEAAVRGGHAPYTERWQVRKPLLDKQGRHILNEDGSWKYGEWEDLPDVTGLALDIVATAEMNGWQFHVIVRDSYGDTVTSAFATLWLVDVPKTGDDAPVGLWLLLACAALTTALATALIAAKKRKKQGAAR